MSRSGFTVIELLVVLTILFILLSCMGFFLPIDFFGNLLVGWFFYLWRTLPAVSVKWEGVATAVVCLAGFAVGLHLFLRWLVGESEKDEGLDGLPRPKWKARWTAGIVGLVLLLFVSGLAATGLAHQAGWLLASPEPIVDAFSGREAARRAQSVNNLKQLGLGLHNYHSQHAVFPPGGTFDATGRGLYGWQVDILPYIEQRELYNTINLALPWDHPRNAVAFRTEVLVFQRPGVEPRADASGYALSHYAGNTRVLGGDRPLSQERITDGLSSTIQAGEAAGQFRPWGHPANWRDPALGINRTPAGFGSPSPDGANFLMADGSVRFFKDTIDPRILEALSTPSGGEPVSDDAY